MRRAEFIGKMGVILAAGCAVGACVVAAVMVKRSVKRRRGWKRVAKVLEDLEVACATPLGRLRQVVDAMAVEMHAGLASDGGSKLKMLITYVHNLPNGREKGTYYALDLGGTNIRVLRIQLAGEKSSLRHVVHEQAIPEYLLTSTSEELFDFVAEFLKVFVEREEEEADNELSQMERRELGFTFSFPVRQRSSLSGTLIKWTKGFSINDMIGKDISQSLQQALYRRGLNMRVAALINDTVGTLALSHYHDEDTVAAVIFGTGTNACYLERTDAIIKSQGLLATSGCMVVNMEWGNFWSSHLPRSTYDIDLDAESFNPNEQGFEKLISGMYLGDIVRRVILRIFEESKTFAQASHKLHVPFVLTTPMVASMHEDDSHDLSEVARILQETLEINDVPPDIRKLIVKTCDVITSRAARLAAAGIIGILKKIGRDGTTGKSQTNDPETRKTVVAVDGSLYTDYRSFREYLNEAVDQLLGHDAASRISIKVMKDGSGIGAAVLVAASFEGT